ncbi:unnamed protein product [Arabis nemorensis]|uniref:Uncharacterized protein n=1 Tax=Arabis nemorensis TaxID=586526 RepID=A0A565BH88_9BRAS|nr:unnamed protein product [Arabis nemorensis]
MKLVTRDVTNPSGKRGTLCFMYTFLNEQETIPPAPPQPSFPTAPPTSTAQPFIIYVPISHQSFGSPNPIHGTSAYAHPGTSNGLHPVYVQPPIQSHGYQQYSHNNSQFQPTQQQTQCAQNHKAIGGAEVITTCFGTFAFREVLISFF